VHDRHPFAGKARRQERRLGSEEIENQLKEKAEEEQLVSALKKYIQQENTGIVYVDMTRLGLVELTRKKNGKTLRELFADGRKEEV
jgi:Ribonuclease G/E